MPDRFAPIPLPRLASWIFNELESKSSIFGIPDALFFRPEATDPFSLRYQDEALQTPIGVAAGPHTQLAQNIIVSYLLGARFIELKTVQTLDELEVAKPCIDAHDETYNCEWSQELRLGQSFSEYLHAYVLLHALGHKLGLRMGEEAGFAFNLSVGYDLAGIKKENVQTFLAQMNNAGEALDHAIDEVAKLYPPLKDLSLTPRLAQSVTLSTMHGCPPQEIEEIGRYLLAERGLHTTIKLNPTLLGPELLRGVLNDELGFSEIVVPDEAFAHDVRFEDAIAMLRRLRELADERRLCFGIKLTNTLEVENHREVFPSGEKMMYMSGRALHPLTVSVAAKLDEAVGPISMSFSGGADAYNIGELLAAGLKPITVCTDLLKPGGYTRLPQYLHLLREGMAAAGAESLDAWASFKAGAEKYTELARLHTHNLTRYAKQAREDARYSGVRRPRSLKGKQKLGFFDCVEAPCRDKCPANQDIPEYLHLVSKGRYDEALSVIRETNPMPHVTGAVCDHACETRCVRAHYDGPLAIRAIKRFVAERATAEETHATPAVGAPRVAIIGAGPAGISAAYYLARAGCAVVVYDAGEKPGGTVAATIPSFRLALDDTLRDARLLQQLGVMLRFGIRVGQSVSFADLLEDYGSVIITSGATVGRKLGIEGESETTAVLDGYAFLTKVRADAPLELGSDVAIIGGGNAAMDAARTAWRLVGAEGKVRVIYRRTRAEMPADPDEIIALDEEGVEIHELATPLRLVHKGGALSGIECQQMKLGERDESGRPRPVPIEGETFELPCSSVIACVSQSPALDYLDKEPVARHRWGTIKVNEKTMATSMQGVYAAGDVVRGPSTIIQAIADGRCAASGILGTAGMPQPTMRPSSRQTDTVELRQRRANRAPRVELPELPLDKRRSFQQVEAPLDEADAQSEATRCLLCDEMCDLCVTVCPNMANLSYTISSRRLDLPRLTRIAAGVQAEGKERFEVMQTRQIVNIADACNECGNCTTFCPTAGDPYRDKPRLCLDETLYAEDGDGAVYIWREEGDLALRAKLGGKEHLLRRNDRGYLYEVEDLRVRLTPELRLIDLEAQPRDMQPGEAGARISLRPAAELATLLEGLTSSMSYLWPA